MIDGDKLISQYFIEMLNYDWITFHSIALLFGSINCRTN
ncbi:Uncharacterised protein [Vibrio cholerae]|nr:Uncharacterised protein [Vibrio cholerae]